jgi:hypothetical protein
MKRREFIALAGGVAFTWPAIACAQSPPVIGFIHQGSPEPPQLTNAFLQGLAETGISEGSFTIESLGERRIQSATGYGGRFGQPQGISHCREFLAGRTRSQSRNSENSDRISKWQ